ncbi:cytochrome c-type biogenesis protein [Pontixanthobacter sp.]|uniref:cytochrome c-type biogenesis protein n=1 Tax=Pontixanthobacter sp. TaxID=2792078 RepID=UPI003C7D6DF3
MRLYVALLCALLMVPPAAAQQSLPPAPLAYVQLDNPADEARAQALMATLRCLTCQSQSIADSDAPMAGDMRHQVRARIQAGEDPEAIRAWLVERYGDYVSYAPTASNTTWPLFAIPLLLLIGAIIIIRSRVGKRAVSAPS